MFIAAPEVLLYMETMYKGSHPLYPVALEVEYKILCRGMEIVGEGKTTWIGSKGLVFIARRVPRS